MIIRHPCHPNHLSKDQDSILRTFLEQFVLVHFIGSFGLKTMGKSPQNGTERVSVTSAKTFFSLKDWAEMKSESSIIYVTMEKKHGGQAPTLGL